MKNKDTNDNENNNENNIPEDTSEEYSFEDLDKEIGLGDILQEKDNLFIQLVKKTTFGLIIVIISVIVFFASFSIGKMLFLTDKQNANQNQVADTYKQEPSEATQNTIIEEKNEITSVSAPVKEVITIKAEKVSTIPKPEPKVAPPAPKPVEPKAKPAVAKPIEATTKPTTKPITKPIIVVPKAVTPQITTVQATIKKEPLKIEEQEYMLIIGMFQAKKNADILSDSVKKLGFQPIQVAITKNEKPYIRLIAGIYNKSKLVSKKNILKEKGIESFSLPYSK